MFVKALTVEINKKQNQGKKSWKKRRKQLLWRKKDWQNREKKNYYKNKKN